MKVFTRTELPRNVVYLLLILQTNFQFASGQSLTIDETISYINELSKKTAGEFEIDDCSCKHNQILTINDEGLITITEYRNKYNCKRSSNNETFPTYEYSFHNSSINFDKIRIDDLIGWIVIPCNRNESNIRKYRLFKADNVSKEEHISELHLSVGSDYNKQKFVNAYRYLFTQISTSQKYKRIDEDPFAPSNYNPKITSSTDGAKFSIALTQQAGVYALPITIGVNRYHFILDSGAGEVSISSEVEKQLISSGILKKTDYLINGLYRIADGSIIVCRRVRLRSMKIGNTTVSNVTSSIGDSAAPLLLGQSFLDKFSSWTIDNKQLQLHLVK